MPLCKERNIEVICDSNDDGEPCIKVLCNSCHTYLTRTEPGWYVIDYGVIKQAVSEHLLKARANLLQLKWQIYRDKIK